MRIITEPSLRSGMRIGRLFLPAVFLFLCISAPDSTGAPQESGQEKHPFQWTNELRRGDRFDNPQIPFTFVAPTDLVFRIWDESNEPRLEARSRNEDSFFLSITGLKNLRDRNPAELRPILTAECHGKLQPISEAPDSLRVRCMEPETSVRPALILLLVLEHFTRSAANPTLNDRASPDRFFLISAVVTSEKENYLTDMRLERKPKDSGHRQAENPARKTAPPSAQNPHLEDNP